MYKEEAGKANFKYFQKWVKQTKNINDEREETVLNQKDTPKAQQQALEASPGHQC